MILPSSPLRKISDNQFGDVASPVFLTPQTKKKKLNWLVNCSSACQYRFEI
jgi:hypothetical protein